MDIALDPSSSKPISRQIADGVEDLIAKGSLQSGHRLPTVRELAGKLHVAPLTVVRAYKLLAGRKLVEAVGKKGTFVCHSHGAGPSQRYLGSLPSIGAIADFEIIGEQIGMRSLATALPDPELFYADEFLSAFRDMSKDAWNFYYSPARGMPQLIDAVGELLKEEQIDATASRLMITQGSTYAFWLAFSCTCKPGDTVLVHQPFRLQLKDSLENLGLHAVPLVDFDSATLESAFRLHHPKAMYVAPSFGAVTGEVLRPQTRDEILRLARQYECQIVEDGCLNATSFHAQLPPPLAGRESRVLFVGSFTYTLVPGLRLGYVQGPSELLKKMAALSRTTLVSPPAFTQAALSKFISSGHYKAHLKRVAPKYRSRADALVGELKFCMPEGAEWSVPEGGYSLWVRLPGRFDTEAVYREAVKSNVAFTPGSLLTLEGGGNCLRLSFGMLPPDDIRLAVRTLGEILARH